MGKGNNLEAYRVAVEQAKRNVQAQKNNIETSKANGNYAKAIRNCGFGGRTGNIYDYNLWLAEQELEKAQERLAKEEKRVNG